MTKSVRRRGALLAGMLTALALAPATMAVAQETPPPGHPAPPAHGPAPKTKPAEIRLGFGAGRMVSISCGDTPIAACIEAAKPLIDQVAATTAVEGRPFKGAHNGWGKPGHDPKKGKKHRPDGEGAAPEAPAEMPPAPPAE